MKVVFTDSFNVDNTLEVSTTDDNGGSTSVTLTLDLTDQKDLVTFTFTRAEAFEFIRDITKKIESL